MYRNTTFPMLIHTKRYAIFSVVAISCAAASFASDVEFPILTQECETALAQSAAPAHLQEDASVYVLTRNGYTLANEGTNPYTCIVQRNHPTSLLPVCFDQEGEQTIVQTILGTAELMLDGKTDTQLNAAISNGLESGDFSEPKLSSVSYMLSDFTWMYDENSETLFHLGPHSMIHAKGITAESMLFDPESYQYHDVLPAIAGMGPFKYFVIRAENATDRSKIESSCGKSLSFLPEKE